MAQQEQEKPSEVNHFYQRKIPKCYIRTIVEAVLQILRIQPEACILLCAPSNPATDTLALRLREKFKPNEMLRLNDHHRTFAEVPNMIMQYCCR